MTNIRLLESSDYHRGYLNLLQQLSPTIDLNNDNIQNFYHQFNHIYNSDTNIFVIEYENKIIASLTLLIEHKFIHNFMNVGHIEDVVVDEKYRRNGLAKMLIEYAVEYSKKHNCYKVILNCDDEHKNFYEKQGFKEKNIEMAKYF